MRSRQASLGLGSGSCCGRGRESRFPLALPMGVYLNDAMPNPYAKV